MFWCFFEILKDKMMKNSKQIQSPWSFPVQKGFANELKWIFCAAGFRFWSRFRFPSLRLVTTHSPWQHWDRKIIFQGKKSVGSRRKMLLWRRKILIREEDYMCERERGKFCAAEKSFVSGRNFFSTEENLSQPERKIISWGEIIWQGPEKDFCCCWKN